jgi:hypothetical protein
MARLIHERIKGSQLTIIPEQKHSILTEVPEVIANLLVRFLRDEGEVLEERGLLRERCVPKPENP